MNQVAYGGIVWRDAGSGVELLLVHRPRYDDWTFPKGSPESGEGGEETALREVEEETGLRCRLGRPVGHKTYPLAEGTKTCHYWAMIPVSGRFSENHEVDEARWIAMDRVPNRLTYDSDMDLLEALPEDWMTPVPRLAIVRHAEAGARNSSDPEDRNRPLSERGRAQAARLVDVLAPETITRLLTSPFERCRQTMLPLSEARGVPVEEVDDLDETAPERSLAYLAVRDAVVCTHGNVMPVMLDALLEDGCEFLSPRRWEKGSTWLIDFEGDLPVRARYLSPP